jgi:hypothetical protein
MKVVYSIIDSIKDGAKPYWQRLGVAFVNKDGSINIFLNGLPVNGKLHIRDEEPRDKDAAPGQGNYAKRSAPPEPEGYGAPQDDDYPF